MVKPKAVKTGAVIGAGTMGSGITVAMLNAGIPVILVEQNKEVRTKSLSSNNFMWHCRVPLSFL